jgi:abequosyltransferase
MNTRCWLSDKQGDSTFDFSVVTELKAYLELSNGLGAMFSYISSLIVRRDEWNSINDNQDFLGCNYAHVHRLFSIAKNGGLVKYIKTPLILARHYNDSFMANGMTKRFFIDLDGYEMLMRHLFNDEEVISLARSVMRREHKWYFLIGLRNKVGKAEWRELERRFAAYGYHPAQLLFIRMLGSSNWFMSSARRVRKVLAG